MFKLIKHLIIALLIIVGVFLYWFIPKYSFVRKNPGYCAKLSEHLFYCGTQAHLEDIFKTANDFKN